MNNAENAGAAERWTGKLPLRPRVTREGNDHDLPLFLDLCVPRVLCVAHLLSAKRKKGALCTRPSKETTHNENSKT